MPHYASLPTLRPRGVYPLDVLSAAGHPVMMAVDSHGRFAGWAEVPPDIDYRATEARLRADLDRTDPLDPLNASRPLRLMRDTPRMSAALSLGIAQIALKQSRPSR